jgi:hypothetical protein
MGFVPSPVVYVREKVVWEYKQLVHNLSAMPNADELNALGKEGWELAGTVNTSTQVYFYFKRAQ